MLFSDPSCYCFQCLSQNQRVALAEITDVLRAVCHAHRFPLALTWIPCIYIEGNAEEIAQVQVRGGNKNPNQKCILCIEDSACYVNDKLMEGFVHACTEHYLEEGQGLAGKALQSNHPFFHSDVKSYDISDYPLVHHARRFGLNAAVAIRLRSTYTGEDDYVLEFFLPVNIKGSTEQQRLLDNLSQTMQRICKTLRTVSDAELVGQVEVEKVGGSIVPPAAVSRRGPSADLSEPTGGPIYSGDGLVDSDGPCAQVLFLILEKGGLMLKSTQLLSSSTANILYILVLKLKEQVLIVQCILCWNGVVLYKSKSCHLRNYRGICNSGSSSSSVQPFFPGQNEKKVASPIYFD